MYSLKNAKARLQAKNSTVTNSGTKYKGSDKTKILSAQTQAMHQHSLDSTDHADNIIIQTANAIKELPGQKGQCP